MIDIEDKKWYWVTATMLAVLVGGGWYYLTPTEKYDVCQVGRTYGEWKNITETIYVNEKLPTVGKYRCDLENKELWCGRTTKTRCYEILEQIEIPEFMKAQLNPFMVDYSEWDFTTIGEDEYMGIKLEKVGFYEFEVSYYLKKNVPDTYKWKSEIAGIEKVYFSGRETRSVDKKLEMLPLETRHIPYITRFRIPVGTTNFTLSAGENTAVVVATATTWGPGEHSSWIHHVFWDKNNDRWHIIYIDSNSDIATASSSDGITWYPGDVFAIGTWGYDDVDCVIDYDGSTTYLHCIRATSSVDSMVYDRFLLNDSAPYITDEVTDLPFDSSQMGGSANDDVEYPRITIDSNDCLIAVFGFEDDSKATADEHQIAMVKEAVPCGDGDWDYNEDLVGGNATYGIQSEAGYNTLVTVGIESFGDLDAQIFWIDSDTEGSYDLETIFYDGDTHTFGTQQTLDVDIEGATTQASYWSVMIGTNSTTFAIDDDTTDLDAYIVVGKDGTLAEQIDTGIDMYYALNYPGLVTAQYDHINGNLTVFAVDDADIQDIYYTISTDNGTTWETPVLWQDDPFGTDAIRILSSGYDSENCDIMVRWVSGTSTSWNITVDILDMECPSVPPVSDHCWNQDDRYVPRLKTDSSECKYYTLTEDFGI